MEDSPELVKLLKYLLFGYLVIQIPLSSFALVLPESGDPSTSSDYPAHNNYPPNPLISPPFSENYKLRTGLNDIDRSSKEVVLRRRGDNRGGGPHFLLNKFGGSLCSIFKTFLDPLENRRRRFNRCHVNSQRPRPRGPPPPPPNSGEMSMAMAMAMAQQEHDQQMAMMQAAVMMGQGQGQSQGHHPGMMMMGDENAYPQQQQARRHQQHDLDDEQINTSGEVDMANVAEEEGHHGDDDHQSLDGMGHHHGPGGDDLIDETKISQDRTMILVPERSCPQGQRRDARGYCRRLVKIRTNYEYGPPPLRASSSSSGSQQQQQNSLVRPIPIRYYYSRIVSIPAFQFFYPNVRV